MSGVDRIKGLGALAAKQHGAFSRQQAHAIGFSATEIGSRLGRGEWIILYRGIYATAVSANTWEPRAAAKLLAAGPESALSRFAAATCLELIDGTSSEIHVVVPAHKRARGQRTGC